MTLKLNKSYAILTLLLFTTEALIAIYLKTGFIRHTFGHFLVVILIYSFFKSILEINSVKLALSVLVFAFIIEFLQLANLLAILNMQNNHLMILLLGSTFNVSDLLAYTLGTATILSIEYKLNKL